MGGRRLRAGRLSRRAGAFACGLRRPEHRVASLCSVAWPAAMFFDDLVVMARGQAPDPIPNSAVKTLSADGTASQGVGE